MSQCDSSESWEGSDGVGCSAELRSTCWMDVVGKDGWADGEKEARMFSIIVATTYCSQVLSRSSIVRVGCNLRYAFCMKAGVENAMLSMFCQWARRADA